MQKSIYKYLVTTIMVAATFTAQAQKEETRESPRKLILENRQPGLLYAPVTASKGKSASGKTFQGSSLRHEIEQGKIGAPVKKGGSSGVAAAPKHSTEKVALPSDAAPVKQEKVIMPIPFIPSQEEGTQPGNESKQDKPATAPAISK